jgi:hypothetical protein
VACLGACVDYVKRRDTITFAAREANAWNRTVHTIDPWPRHAWNTRIEGDGRRVERVIRRYSGEAEDSGAPKGQAGSGGRSDNAQDGARQGAGAP